MTKFAQRLKAYRKAKGFTQEELSRKVGLSKNAVSNYEKNRSKPGFSDLLKICEVLDTDPNSLIWDQPTVKYQSEDEFIHTAEEYKEEYQTNIKSIRNSGLRDEAKFMKDEHDRLISENIKLIRECDQLKKQLDVYKDIAEKFKNL